jgi:hypothetical protein
VWLVPFQSDADYEELCACYAKILLSDDEKAGAPAYCKHVQSRAGWTELLPSLGATQIGGELGDQAASLAWLGRDQNRRKSGGSSQGSLSVLAFTVPLRPSRATGITHAQLPLLVKELLIWQGLLPPGPGGNTGAKANANSAIWPRYDDINSLWAASAGEGLGSSTSGGSRDVAKNLSPDLLLKLKQSNVPLGESLMASAPTSQLPPRWTTQMAVAERQSPAKKEREDPLPWLQLLTALVLIAAGTEAVAAITARLLRATRRPVAQAGSTATVQGEAQL